MFFRRSNRHVGQNIDLETQVNSNNVRVKFIDMKKLVAYQIKGSGVHGNEFWHVGVLAVAALNYVGGPSLQRASMIRVLDRLETCMAPAMVKRSSGSHT